MTDEVLRFDGVHIDYASSEGDLHAVSDASFSIDENEYFGLVGESGCGKSTLASAAIRGIDDNGRVTEGSIEYKGDDIQDMSSQEFNRELRWNEIAIIPQSSMNSLNPLERISKQAHNIAKSHTNWSKEQTVTQLQELFEVVGLPTARVHDYPHQFSGGMQQRAIISLSLLLEPSLVIADEPTTALDVIMQDQFLKHLDQLREVRDFSLLFITHDIAVVFELCDSMAVMHAGQVAETGPTTTLFDTPRHPYTILLQQSFPDYRYPDRELKEIDGSPPSLRGDIDFCTFADRCPWSKPDCRNKAPPLESSNEGQNHQIACIRQQEMTNLADDYLTGDPRRGGNTATAISDESTVKDDETILELRDLHKHFDPSANVIETLKQLLPHTDSSSIRAVDGVNLDLKRNQIQGIIGESGCGKSTLLKTLIGLYKPTDGEYLIQGQNTSTFDAKDWKELKRNVQIIFQDPFNTINPHFTVREALREPLRIHDEELDEDRILDMLEQVELNPPEKYIDRKESQLSGGEKQRVAIARALILNPEVVLADEPVSMLDVSTQAAILDLLSELTDQYDVSMVYVSHDLSTVSYVCDRVNVMYLGRIVENAPTRRILNEPKHPYTRALLQAVPIPDPHHERAWTNLPGAAGDPQELGEGCRFRDRCPDAMDICEVTPLFREVEDEDDHRTACHLHYDHEEVTAGSVAEETLASREVIVDE